jgi:ribosomal protein L18
MIPINDSFALDRLVLKSHQSKQLIRSSRDEQLIQSAILGERIGRYSIQAGSRSWKRAVAIGAGIAAFIGALLGLGFKVLRG